MPIDFQSFLLQKNDEIDNAAYSLAVALLRAYPEQSNESVLKWNMQIIAPIIEATVEVLKNFGKECCHPFTTDNEAFCFCSNDCKNMNCPHENAAVAEILIEREKTE